MKKIFGICILAAMVSMASCSNKDEDADYAGEGLTEMTANINDLSGTELKTYYVSNGDGTKYSCNWSEKDAYMFTDGTVVSKFSNDGKESVSRFGLVEGQTAPSKSVSTYYAYYPSDGYKSYSGGTFSVTLPATQTYTEGTVANGAFPLLGIAKRSEGTSGVVTNFYNLATFVIVRVKTNGGENKVKSIELSTSKEPLSGPAEASFDADGTPILNMTGANASVKLDCGSNGVAINDKEKTLFFIAIPYGSFTDFTVTVNCENGSPLVSNKGNVSFNRGKYRGTSVYFDAVIAGGTGNPDDVID